MENTISQEAVVVATIRVEKVTDFERMGERNGRWTNDVATVVNVKVGNIVKLIRLSYEQDWSADGKPRVANIREDSELKKVAAGLGVVLDYSDVLAAYIEFAKVEVEKDQQAARLARATAYDAHWAHQFIIDASTLEAANPLPMQATFAISKSREDYVDGKEGSTWYDAIHIIATYRGYTQEIEREKGEYRTGSYYGGSRHRATKLVTILRSVKSDIDRKIKEVCDKNSDIARRTALEVQLRNRLIGYEVNVDKASGSQAVKLPGSWNNFRFCYNAPNQYHSTESFSVDLGGISSPLSFDEFVIILATAKAAVERR